MENEEKEGKERMVKREGRGKEWFGKEGEVREEGE